jgi:pantothenate kinase
VDGAKATIVFASGPTHQLERAAIHIKDLMEHSLGSSSPFSHSHMVEKEAKGIPRKIAAAGGGAHKFKGLFREALGVELMPQKELKAVVDGLLLLESHGPANALFTVEHDTGAPVELEWPETLFPFLVVNMGSGVSVLRVNRPGPGGYERVGGTACGGGTFLGLCTLLTSANSYEEALRLAVRGDASRVDKLVGDIYGPEGCADLGMSASVTAANFGKLSTKMEDGGPFASKMTSFTEADLAAAALQVTRLPHISGARILIRPSLHISGARILIRPSLHISGARILIRPSLHISGSRILIRPSLHISGSRILIRPSLHIVGARILIRPSLHISGARILIRPSLHIVGARILIRPSLHISGAQVY